MKTTISKILSTTALLCFLVVLAPTVTAQELKNHVEYKGKITDGNTQEPLEAVSVNLKNTNISTISNIEGKFVLKVPQNMTDGSLVFNFLGYQPKEISLKHFQKRKTRLR
ncbi:MAG: hypothetical protein CL524_13615 [Aequorivita sp.]|nr:hypothetical protein [Aequorivita sp.]MBF30698.1 hypothetical protein [Aequorivita sp.]|tara:strand:- start:55227 stop:55556 length:330 start_codon:yes stop_codon:yes gene_type:complete